MPSSDNEAAEAVQVSEGTSPEAVKKRFRGYKRLLIKLVGRGPMGDTKINEIGKVEFGDRWAGVYPSSEKAVADARPVSSSEYGYKQRTRLTLARCLYDT